MREPPPRPLDTSASSPRKPQKLYNPCSPSLGSQKFFLIRYGLRGNEPGGYAFPLSRRQTRRPASASRYVITDPPNPDPMTTAWKCVSFILAVHLRRTDPISINVREEHICLTMSCALAMLSSSSFLLSYQDREESMRLLEVTPLLLQP